jgi:D-apionolactonase
MAGAVRCVVEGVDAARIACVAARDAQGHVRIVVANLTDEACDMRLRVEHARGDALHVGFLGSGAGTTKTALRDAAFTLDPYAVLIATSAA